MKKTDVKLVVLERQEIIWQQLVHVNSKKKINN